MYKEWNPTGTKKLVVLHGFTGSSRSFERVVEMLSEDIHVIAPTLPGHGEIIYSYETMEMHHQINWLEDFLQQHQLKEATVLGYSMGGRLAMGYAQKFPVKQLILVSSSPGIELQNDRDARHEADQNLAEKIRRNGLDWFVSYWENIPLFESQKRLPVDVQQMVRSERLQHDAEQLATSLEDFSTGNMPSYWNELENYHHPVHMVVGELDTKFVEIAKKMSARLPNATLRIVPNVGHAIQVENPQMFATIIEDVL